MAITLLGLWLRVGWIGHESVGHDEAFSMLASRQSFTDMMPILIRDFVHPPLHYFLLHGWFRLAGWGVFQARLLSAIFSTLAIAVLYLLARLFFNRPAALIASFLLAMSQLTIMFADEPRPYAQVLLLSLGSAYLFVRALRENRRDLWWWFVACAITTLYTHYFGFFTILGLLAFAVIYRSRYKLPLTWLAAGVAAVTVVYVPWLASGIISAGSHSGRTLSGKAPWWAVHWYTFITTLNSFNNGKPAGLLATSPSWTYLAGGLLFCAPAMLAVWMLWRRRSTVGTEEEGTVLALLLWLLPVIAAIGLGTLHIQYNVRYVSFAAAPYYVLVGRGISGLRLPAARWTILALIAGYSAYSLRANFSMQWKEDFRGAYQYVTANRAAGDCAVFLPYFAIPYEWQVEQSGHPPFRAIPEPEFAEGAPNCSRVWAVSSAPGENPNWEARSQDLKGRLGKIRVRSAGAHFFGVQADLYTSRQPTAF